MTWFLHVVALLIVIGFAIPISSGMYDSLQEKNWYPDWINLLLAISIGILAGAVCLGILCLLGLLILGLLIFFIMLLDKPLLALSVAGLLLYWLFALVVGLISSIMDRPVVPGLNGSLGVIVTVVFVILGIIGAFKNFADNIESGQLEKTINQFTHEEIKMPTYTPNHQSGSRVKYRGEGFVIYY